MTKESAREILSSPPALSLLLWIIICLLLPPMFSKYKFVHISDEQMAESVRYYFCDLNSDNQSEKILVDLNDNSRTQIIISTDDNVIDQYNLKHQAPDPKDFYTCDYNNDGFSECFIFTRNSDSIFLNIIDPYNKQSMLINNRFVDTWHKAEFSENIPWIEPISLLKRKDSVYSDIVFTITTGFSKQPRNVYVYSVKEDYLIKSPESSVDISRCIMSDLDNDKQKEIILSTNATGNFEESASYSDQFTWLMVLNNRLNFIFPPVRFAEYPSRLQVVPMRTEGQTNLIIFNDYFGSKDIKSYFYLYDYKGNKIIEKEVSSYDSNCHYILPNPDTTKKTFFFIRNKFGEIEELNDKFEIIARYKIPEIEEGKPIYISDINNDGKMEYFLMGKSRKSIIIIQNDMADPVSIPLDRAAGYPIVSKILRNEAKSEFYIQFEGYGSYFRFYKNPLFNLRYIFHIAVYLAILSFVLIISKITQYRNNLKLQTEREIASLQMKAIKNQIDPHFTLNILNAIGSLYASDTEKDKADFIFAKYAKLIRQTVISSDQIIISLSEEIDFVRNYLDLEQFRLKDLFRYQIIIGKDVDNSVKIPRMLVHSFVENAIKHGIRNRARDGNLSINISKIPGAVQINIEDNGTGIGSGSKSDYDTGKGLLIINDMIELYYRLMHSKITYTIKNILKADNSVTGARAQIKIFS